MHITCIFFFNLVSSKFLEICSNLSSSNKHIQRNPIVFLKLQLIRMLISKIMRILELCIIENANIGEKQKQQRSQ